jgi:hypothetical protein
MRGKGKVKKFLEFPDFAQNRLRVSFDADKVDPESMNKMN